MWAFPQYAFRVETATAINSNQQFETEHGSPHIPAGTIRATTLQENEYVFLQTHSGHPPCALGQPHHGAINDHVSWDRIGRQDNQYAEASQDHESRQYELPAGRGAPRILAKCLGKQH
jgi:hypothetical protein